MKTRILYLGMTLFSFVSLQTAFSQPCPNPQNLVTNGDFSNGFTGFTSGLSVGSGCSTPTDFYNIGTAFDDFCSSFPSTPNGVDMMVVDFHNFPTDLILQQNISGVAAGTDYEIGFRGASRRTATPVPVDVFYDSYFIGTITINTPASFGTYSLNWTAPSGVPASGNFTLRLDTAGGQDIWMDFALTDIEFSVCSSKWRKTYANGKYHNHFSVVEIEDEIVVGGTTYEGELGDTKVQVMRLNGNTGAIIWEEEYELGADERCFDISLGHDGLLALTGYAQTSSAVSPRTFVMLIDPNNGSIVDYREFALDLDQSTGLDILYSEKEGAYFIAGYQSEEILNTSSDKYGYVLSIDPSLGVNWVELIFSPASRSDRNMANNLTEIEGQGIFVTGSVNHDPAGGSGSVSTLKMMFDYGGGLVWDLTSSSTNSHECGVDAVYDPREDFLYVMSNNSVVHTFEIQRIDNASNPGAVIATHGSSNLLNTIAPQGINSAGFSLDFDPTPGSENLIVAGMTREMYLNGNVTDHSPSFIANVDPNSFNVTWFRYIQANNLNYRDHDHDVFQAFWGQQALINYPDLLGTYPSNFFLLGYTRTDEAYSLSVTKTDINGHSLEECEISVEAEGFETSPDDKTAYADFGGAEDIKIGPSQERTGHEEIDGCPPLPKERKSAAMETGIESGEFRLYPNPSHGILYIEGPAEAGMTYRLFDVQGRLMQHATLNASSGNVKIDMSNLEKGIYFLSLPDGRQEKIILQ